jgi:hypothetical protein
MKKLFTICFLLISCTLFAQDKSVLLGKWSVTFGDSDDKAIYEFRKENDNIIGYCISYTEGEEIYDNLNDKIIDQIEMNGKTGTSILHAEEEGKEYKLKCKILLISDNNIKVKYNYLLYSGEQEWKRI